MFYQSQHSLGADILKTEREADFSFPTHLHNSFELITVTEGEMDVTVDQKSYLLQAGEACLIFPNQIHALQTRSHSRHFLCIFSQKYVQAYSKSVLQKIPTDNLFRPDPHDLDKLMNGDAETDLFSAKGILYSLCSAFHRERDYTERKSDENDLLFRIFHFVEEGFHLDCTLKALAEQTAYHYVYLSKYFKQCTGISFTEYVNRYRVNEACYLLKNAEQSILQTALDCGFESLRSFNRNFKTVIGMTPSEYREKR